MNKVKKIIALAVIGLPILVLSLDAYAFSIPAVPSFYVSHLKASPMPLYKNGRTVFPNPPCFYGSVSGRLVCR